VVVEAQQGRLMDPLVLVVPEAEAMAVLMTPIQDKHLEQPILAVVVAVEEMVTPMLLAQQAAQAL
jgi:hypothetical protein